MFLCPSSILLSNQLMYIRLLLLCFFSGGMEVALVSGILKALGTKLASLVTKKLMSIADVGIDLAGTPRSS
jgi:hypothetical protein